MRLSNIVTGTECGFQILVQEQKLVEPLFVLVPIFERHILFRYQYLRDTFCSGNQVFKAIFCSGDQFFILEKVFLKIKYLVFRFVLYLMTKTAHYRTIKYKWLSPFKDTGFEEHFNVIFRESRSGLFFKISLFLLDLSGVEIYRYFGTFLTFSW